MYCEETEDYAVPNVLSPRDLDIRPDYCIICTHNRPVSILG